LYGPTNYYRQMVAMESSHDPNPKTLLNGTILPAGQTAEQDMAEAMTNVFQHPNTPPFVCQQLIQHLVKSNPSPGYVSRVAAVFINDGNNVRGNMPAAMRGLGYVNVDPNGNYQHLSTYTRLLGEPPYGAASVFNFFPPNYVIPGTTLSGPEFALENTASVTDRLTLANQLVNNGLHGFNVDLSATSPLGQVLTSQGPSGLVSALSNLFLYGTMDANTAAVITNAITTAPGINPAQQIRLAVYLVITSPQYKILH
jgi:hypothetical protein